MNTESSKLGIGLMVLTMFIFAMQDGISRYLADEYNVIMVVMIRYWFFAAFVVALTSRRTGGVKQAAATKQPLLQVFRGALLAVEICVTVLAFTLLGLVESHAVFACYPLIVAALSGPLLGERVGWRRWTAIGAGFIGVLIILQPGITVFRPEAAIAILAAGMFALYALLTRYAARRDSATTSFFYTGTVGAVVMTGFGLWAWEPMTQQDWAWMILLCITGASGHYTLIKTYELAEASAVQPFAYLHLIFASALGVLVFEESIAWNVAAGAGVIVAAGLFTLWREHQASQKAPSTPPET